MNKPAPQEPSMDEILSSIRQIIADDDAGSRRPAAPPTPQPTPPSPPLSLRPQIATPVQAQPEPLALSAAQIVPDESDDDEGDGAAEPPLSYQSILSKDGAAASEATSEAPQLVDPEDVTFEEQEPEPPPPAYTPPPRLSRPTASVAKVAPMPDPRLSADLAERLIEPATRAAVQQNFAKLSNSTQVPSGQTIDGMMREMLRPMLKAWLDEHLPSVVERMVEKEIARVSRGVE